MEVYKDRKEVDVFQEANNRITDFFSKGWNIVRFLLFIFLFGMAALILLNSFQQVPPGGSLTWSILLHQTYVTITDFNSRIPVLGWLFEQTSDFVAVKEVNFLIFLSAFIATLSILSCLCK